MEVVANRNYYKTKTGDIRVRVRAYDRNTVNCINSIKELCDNIVGDTDPKAVKFAKKPELDDDSEQVKEFNFAEMHYDNSGGKDRFCHHAVIFADSHDDAKDVSDLISRKLGGDFQIISRKVNDKSYTISVGFPISERGIWRPRCGLGNEALPIYPLCIISYKRANDECGLTHKTLCRMKLKHYIFVEPFEYEEYCKWADGEYATIVSSGENFSMTQKMGSTPMRNFALDWGLERDFERIWMLDDNIVSYIRYHEAKKNKIESASVFTSVENYIERFDNVGIVSHNFSPLVREGEVRKILVKNGKCYSSLLIQTYKYIRFRHKHQEDNLISIENIQKGLCTLCFNHVQYLKHTSGTDRGGNREEIYKCEGNALDGEGYRERYEFFEKALEVLHAQNLLPLRKEFADKGVSAFLSRSTTMKSKQYHARCNYASLHGFDYIKRGRLPLPTSDDIDPLVLEVISSPPSTTTTKSSKPVVVKKEDERVKGSRFSFVKKERPQTPSPSPSCCSSCEIYKAKIAELEAKLAKIQLLTQ